MVAVVTEAETCVLGLGSLLAPSSPNQPLNPVLGSDKKRDSGPDPRDPDCTLDALASA